MADNWFKAEVAFACPYCGQRSSEILFANASRHDPNAVARGIQQAVAPLTCRRCKKVAPAGIKIDIGMNDLKPEDVAKENLPLPSLPPFDPARPCPCGLHGKSYGDCCKDQGTHALGNAMLRGTAPITVPGARTTISSSMVMGDTRFRFVWNTLWKRPQTEPFDQFLDALVYATLGKEWFDEQAQRAPEKRHAVAKWREAMVELRKRPPHIDDGFHVAHTLTGPVKAYQCFGYDLYWLQLFHELPASLIERLKDFHGFQGARYEVLIAAVFARAGFDIEWIDDDKAAQQSPEGGIPFLIFIDANVPDSPPKGLPSYDHIPIETAPWMVEIRDRLVSIWTEASEQSPESGVLVTNFAFSYGDNESPSPTGMGAFFPSPKPRVPILGDPMLADIEYCLRSYDKVPRQL